MSEYDTFMENAKDLQIVLESEIKDINYSPLTNDALFHLPFLVLAILCITKGRRKVTTADLGHLFSQAFERTITGYKKGSQMISWSANLRLRTAKALEFLECSSMVFINYDKSISPTDTGKLFINSVLSEASFLGVTLRKLSRNFNDLKSEKQINLL